MNLAERSRRLLVDPIDLLRDALRIVKQRHPFHIDAMVVLPDHVHAIWTLPPGEVDYPMRWTLIKAGFSRRLPKGERINASRKQVMAKQVSPAFCDSVPRSGLRGLRG